MKQVKPIEMLEGVHYNVNSDGRRVVLEQPLSAVSLASSYLEQPGQLCPGCKAPYGNLHAEECSVSTGREGRKDDEGKTRFDLINPDFLFALSDVLTYGANKYGARNWEKGMKWSRVFGALMRHMWAWWKGERYDSETNLSHLAHAAACIMFLVAYEMRQMGEDDRP